MATWPSGRVTLDCPHLDFQDGDTRINSRGRWLTVGGLTPKAAENDSPNNGQEMKEQSETARI